MERIVRRAIMGILCAVASIIASGPKGAESAAKDTTESAATGAAASGGAAYRIDKPGTLTFTGGVKIKGKVEKPQVMIFLPKEKPYYHTTTFSYSFSDEIMKPLPFTAMEK
jgi:hypothetical protein